MKYVFLIFQCLLFVSSLSSQSIFDVYRDPSEIKELETKPVVKEIEVEEETSEEFSNPFEVSHIPIRKNQEIKSASRRDTGTFELSKKDSNTISPLVILFTSAIILGLILFYYRGIIADMIQSLMNMNYMQTFMAKSLSQHLFYTIGLYIIFILNAGLFVVLSYKTMAEGNPVLPLFYVILSVLVIYALRHLFLLIFGWIFELEGEAGTFSFLIALLNMSMGLALIPINLFIAFAPSGLAKVLVFIGVFVIALMIGLRYFRGTMLSSKRMGSAPFQFFLYFCTFEIAPVLVILYWIGLYG